MGFDELLRSHVGKWVTIYLRGGGLSCGYVGRLHLVAQDVAEIRTEPEGGGDGTVFVVRIGDVTSFVQHEKGKRHG